MHGRSLSRPRRSRRAAGLAPCAEARKAQRRARFSRRGRAKEPHETTEVGWKAQSRRASCWLHPDGRARSRDFARRADRSLDPKFRAQVRVSNGVSTEIWIWEYRGPGQDFLRLTDRNLTLNPRRQRGGRSGARTTEARAAILLLAPRINTVGAAPSHRGSGAGRVGPGPGRPPGRRTRSPSSAMLER